MLTAEQSEAVFKAAAFIILMAEQSEAITKTCMLLGVSC
jgi:hypothetical protein